MGFFFCLNFYYIWFMDEKLKIVLAWIVVVIFGIPLLISLLGISFINLVGLAIVVWAILLLYKKYRK